MANGSDTISLGVSGGHSLTNSGTLDGGTNGLEVTADEIFLNSGSVVTVGVTLNGDVTNAGDLSLDTDLSGDLTTQAGSVVIAGNVDGGTHAVTVGGGSMTVSDGIVLSNVGTLTNSADLSVGDNATLEAATINNETGAELTLGSDATLRGTGNTLTNAGSIVVGDGGTVVDAGDINNQAGARSPSRVRERCTPTAMIPVMGSPTPARSARRTAAMIR